MGELMHSWHIKEVVHFNFINKANMYNVTTDYNQGFPHLHAYFWWEHCFFYTKFKDTWFCIIYLELDLLVKTLREGMSQLFINDDFALKY